MERDDDWVMPGEDAPGRWVPDETLGLRTWQGKSRWRTRHGEAVVHWLLGRPIRVENASTPEGLLDIRTASPADPDTWRRRSPALPGGWVHGTAEITGDGVVFADLPRRLARPRGTVGDGSIPDLARDLSGDGPFIARIRDAGFAHAVYEGMCNASFRFRDHRRRWSISWRSAAGLVADMRDIGETYTDYYLATWVLDDGREPGGGEREALTAEVDAHYARLGWARLDTAELARDHAAAMADLVAAEARPDAPRPDWTESYVPRDPRTPSDRAVMAARSGRLSRDEMDSLLERFDFEAESKAGKDNLRVTLGGGSPAPDS